MRALEKNTYLTDEKLVAINPKIKPPVTPNPLQLLHMNSSAGGIQDQSSTSSADDIFPPTISVR